MMKKILLLIISAVCAFSCANENSTEPVCNYSVILQQGFTSGTENLSANVSINTGTEVFTQTAEFPLTAVFETLPCGRAVVDVSSPGFCTVRYKIVLTENSSVSTKIQLLPDGGENAAILKGKLQTPDLLSVSENIKVIISPVDSIEKFIEGGEIYDVYIENFSRKEVFSNLGEYEITLPATTSGIKYAVNADGFFYENTALELKTDTITLFSGKTSVKNLVYSK